MKRNHSSGAKNVKCNKCDKEAHSIPGRRHRKCSGHADQPNRKSGNYLPSAERGTWT